MLQIFQFGIIGDGGVDPTQIGAGGILELGLSVVNIALSLIGGIALIYIIIGGIQYMTAAGDPKAQADARKAITAAVIGVIIVAFSFWLTNQVLRGLQFDDTILRNPETKPIQTSFPDIKEGSSQ